MYALNKFASAALIGVVLVSGSAAFAGDKVKNNGTIVMNTVANRTTALALGRNSVAKNEIGVISGDVTNNGTVVMNTVANRTTALALGRNSKACNRIGVISSETDCK